jgi:hypothetical protein
MGTKAWLTSFESAGISAASYATLGNALPGLEVRVKRAETDQPVFESAFVIQMCAIVRSIRIQYVFS